MSVASPKIQFFTKSSGESVAYAINGQGSPLVVPAWWVSHLELDWQNTNFQKFFLALGKHHTIIRYDRPGAGLSDRHRDSFDIKDEVATLTELIDHLELPGCDLLGISCGGPVATLYATENPERVSKLVYVGSFAHGQCLVAPEMQEILCALVSAHWGMGAKAILDLFDPDMSGKQRKELSKLHRHSATPEMATLLLKLTFSMDVREAASQLSLPSLVIHRNKDNTVPFDAGRQLASTLRNAQLASFSGEAHLPWVGEEAEDIIAEILQFTATETGKQRHPATEDNEAGTPNQFKQTGDIWSLCFAKKTVHLKHSRGLEDIAFLLANGNKEVHVKELTGGQDTTLIEESAPVLDNIAIRNYQVRLQEIEEEKILAANTDDDRRYEELEQEQDSITESLKQGMGLGGRQRSFSNDSEKARKAVSARIRTTIKRIEKVHPELAEHLNQSLNTGTFCCYNSDDNYHWIT